MLDHHRIPRMWLFAVTMVAILLAVSVRSDLAIHVHAYDSDSAENEMAKVSPGHIRVSNSSRSNIRASSPHKDHLLNCNAGAMIDSVCQKDIKREDRLPTQRVVQAVGRLRVVNGKTCSGVILSNTKEVKFFLTAANCFANDDEIKAATVEFTSCGESTLYTFNKFYYINRRLDYAILEIATKDDLAFKFGFLSLRKNGPYMDEAIFIPQYQAPGGWRLATGPSQDVAAKVQPFQDVDKCTTNAPKSRITYAMLGMEAEHIGVPVVSVFDGAMIGLHVCGECLSGVMNSALSGRTIVVDLNAKGLLLDFLSAPGRWKDW